MTIAPAVSCVTSPVQEYEDGASTPSVEYIRGSDYGGGIGGILYTLRGSAPSFKHYNSRGDVVAATNASGSLTYQAAYEAFGQHGTTDSSAEWTDGATPLDRQQGNTKDEDPTGLLNEGFRYRDLETGTFITPDPLGFIDGPNVYTYVVQNPWTKFDPLGLYGRPTSPSYTQSRFGRGGTQDIQGPMTWADKTAAVASGATFGGMAIAYVGPAVVAKEVTSEGADMAAEAATGLPIPATSLTGLVRDGLQKAGKETVEVAIEQTAKETKEQTAKDFYKQSGFSDGATAEHMKGIDLDKPVEIERVKSGTRLEQYEDARGQGNYYAEPGANRNQLGIDPTNRQLKTYEAQRDVDMLNSTAGDIPDWNGSGRTFKGGEKQRFSTEKDAFKEIDPDE